jgi:uncharacterized protein (TIGR02246 family)
MRRSIQLVGLAASISVAAACGGSSNRATQSGEVAQAGGPAKADKAADEASLRAIYQKMPSQLMAADTAAVGALFADDGVEVMPGAPPTSGREAIKKEFASTFMSMKNLKLTIGDLAITVADAGDLAVVKAPYRTTYVDAKGKPAEDRGTTLTVFKKVNGQWKILIDSNISEVPPT